MRRGGSGGKPKARMNAPGLERSVQAQPPLASPRKSIHGSELILTVRDAEIVRELATANASLERDERFRRKKERLGRSVEAMNELSKDKLESCASTNLGTSASNRRACPAKRR